MISVDSTLHSYDTGLVLVVPPNRIDVAEVRRYSYALRTTEEHLSTADTSAPAYTLTREPNQDLLLVVQPRRIDVISVRAYFWGNVVMWCGLALLAPSFGAWDVYARMGTVALGLVCGYLHVISAVFDYAVPVRFRFGPKGELSVSTARGKAVRHTKRAADSSVLLQRKGEKSPRRFRWSYALATVATDLSPDDFQALVDLGLNLERAHPDRLQTTFTRLERRMWWVWGTIWISPWIGVAYKAATAP